MLVLALELVIVSRSFSLEVTWHKAVDIDLLLVVLVLASGLVSLVKIMSLICQQN